MIEVAASGRTSAVDLDPLISHIVGTARAEGVGRATVGLMIVDAREMTRLNRDHRGVDRPTDVLSFPIDGVDPETTTGDAPPVELGDIVICPEAAEVPLTTLVVHGALHLLGYDHEVDGGEMLRRQDELVALLGAL